ncbi:hypothetical protein [Bacillus atrophaeus]|uniref:hypothetical protein n=1 Tax=Bacillus atrophaeus TaxID=1452 RepID=UPI00227F3B80|nr:hypothetical protein [Bacillus atrophaeus]MCY8489131.1 hypothetical protein [Bacillus atrophaeus]MCY8507288.1 hypothetical protein [Bacillus atrophaeus]MCY8949070.1 hypothetical protein [Bacillus atrophaeus]MCY8972270.1 hypothetical protein [Bacillus atrophaeus]
MTLLFYLLKRELAAEAVSISSTDEAKTEFKKIMAGFILLALGYSRNLLFAALNLFLGIQALF